MIYENNTLKRILVDGGYIEDGRYYFYVQDHLGNNRMVVDQEGEIAQITHYYPFGMSFAESTNASKQPYKYNGKELDTENNLNTYDYEARLLSVAVPRFTTIDPHAENYYSWSPYVYCYNNPLKYIDPDGKDVKPIGEEALEMIQNTLSKDDMKYVQFDKNMLIDKELINSHKSESGNFGALLELVNSDILIEVSLGDEFSYMDNEGNIQDRKMSYQEADPEFADTSDNVTLNGTTTGEAGFMGVALLPGKGISGQNSPDKSIKIIMNKNLSLPARAEMYSHEANGHALMYVRTRNRTESGHKFEGSRDVNKPLVKMILDSKKETIKNMQGR
ncbi:MAG: RHS repeat-associated core domain-containing protein [Bacteroidales bacterium]|nr:RHS repeat-associated core domain-containing protein [Bacteroidales bacterium]